jgi:hypothetical protein
MNRFFIFVSAGVCLTLTSCASKRNMIFSSAEPGSTIAVVPLDNPDGAVQTVGNPFNTNTARLTGKAVRISANGKAPQFWFPPDDSSHRIEVKVKNLPVCSQSEGNRNRPLRLLLKAYQALTEKDFNLARELCTKAAQIDPTLAAPLIITGLTYFQEGKRTEARVAFNKAKALDPEDQELNELLRMVQ